MKKERMVVITGAGSGMGRCMSRYFAQNGWVVCVVDISQKSAYKTYHEIEALAAGSIIIKADIRDTLQIREIIGRCVDEYGHIDAWVNNAGVTDKQHRNILNVPYEVWNEILSVNLYGTFACMKECVALMEKQGFGNIVNITSLLGQSGYTRPGDTAYGVSKAAVEALTKYAAREFEESGININSAYPGAMVNTGFFDYLEENERAKLERPTIMNELVYVLCSLAPGELSGKSFSFQNWKQNPELIQIYPKYLHGEGE